MSNSPEPLVPPPLPTDAPAPNRGRWLAFLGLMVGYILLTTWRGSDPNPGAPALSPTVGGLLADTTIGLLVFFVPFFAGVALVRPTTEDFFISRPLLSIKGLLLSMAWSIALRFLITIPAAVLVGILYITRPKTGLQEFAASRPKIENLLDPSALADPVYAVLCMTWLSFIVAGVREELWRAALIRGVLSVGQGLAPARFLTLGAIFLSSAFFGVAHLTQGWIGVLFTLILGIGLAAIQVYRRSIQEAILAHGFFDAATFFFLFLLQQKGLIDKLGLPKEMMP